LWVVHVHVDVWRAWLIGLVALLAAVGATSAHGGSVAAREVEEQIHSVALKGDLHALVWLPPGYETSRERYPVVYFLHGLPAAASSFKAIGWLEDAFDRAGAPAILVAPEGARTGDTDAEYLDRGPGRDWESFVTRELPRAIDARFRTIRSRGGRALVGLSAGGYGASILGLKDRGTFSVVESWSGYFHPTDPTGTVALALGPGTSVHTYVQALRDDPSPTFFGFYVGSGDSRFREENVELDAELKAAGVPHVFALYPGGHTTSLWSAHAVAWLRLALAHLRPAVAVP
jgi:enterochelin esterase-like enzyme